MPDSLVLGIEVDPLPDNYTPLEAVGMLTVALDVERQDITTDMEDE